MSKTVARLEPNPIVTENIANFMCPKRMFRDDKPIVVLPNSRVDIARTCTGTVGYLNHECLYPLVLVGDCGCGVAALIIDEDAELPDNYQELITQALSEEYSEEDPEKGLGLSFEEYPGDEIDMYIKSCQLITEMVNSGDDDTYLTSSIISPNNVPEPFKTLVMSDRAEGGGGSERFQKFVRTRLSVKDNSSTTRIARSSTTPLRQKQSMMFLESDSSNTVDSPPLSTAAVSRQIHDQGRDPVGSSVVIVGVDPVSSEQASSSVYGTAIRPRAGS